MELERWSQPKSYKVHVKNHRYSWLYRVCSNKSKGIASLYVLGMITYSPTIPSFYDEQTEEHPTGKY